MKVNADARCEYTLSIAGLVSVACEMTYLRGPTFDAIKRSVYESALNRIIWTQQQLAA